MDDPSIGMVFSIPVRCILAVVSGAVYAAAYPPFGMRALVLLGIAGLLLALRGLGGTRARAVGFLHGLTAYAVSLSWLYQIFGAMVVVLWIVLAAFTALFAEMQGRAGLRGISGWKMAAFTAVNWCGWEFIRAEIFPLRFPWMTAGLAMGPNALLPWIGVYGVSLLVVLVAALFVVRRAVSAGLVAAVLAAAVYLPSRVPEPAADDPRSLVVAGSALARTADGCSFARHRAFPNSSIRTASSTPVWRHSGRGRFQES